MVKIIPMVLEFYLNKIQNEIIKVIHFHHLRQMILISRLTLGEKQDC